MTGMTDLSPFPIHLRRRVGLEPALCERLRGWVDERASKVDEGDIDLREALRFVADQDVLAMGATGGADAGLPAMAGVVSVLAGGCLSTAFVTWAHRSVIEYVSASDNDRLREELLPLLADAELVGATAMARAFQAALGLRDLDVRATRDGTSLVLDGHISWSSNLYPEGSLIVLPAATDHGRRCVVAVPTPTAGLELAPYPPLLALGSTASTSVQLDQVRVDERWVVSDRFDEFLSSVRPAFLLLQAAFCIGLAAESLRAVRGQLDGPAATFMAELTSLQDRYGRTVREVADQTQRVGGPDPPTDEEITRVRLDAARAAVDAVQLESKTAGGAGYLATSPTARRIREAAFLPIQSPTEAQLLWELSRSA